MINSLIIETLKLFNQYNGLLMVFLTVFLVWFSQKNIQVLKDIEKDKRKPAVLFDIYSKDGDIFFILINNGLSPAYDVSVKISPEPIRSETIDLPRSTLLINKILFLAPGRELIDFFDSGYSFFQKNEKDEYKVFIEYSNENKKNTKIEYVINLHYQKTILRSVVTRNDLQETNKNLKSIEKAITKLTGSQTQQK